jgi:molybdopterin synthase catalytic subunit
MIVAPLAVLREPLSIETLVATIERETRGAGEGCGAVATFIGIVRATSHGRRVRHLEYEAFVPLAVKVFERIAGEARGEWPDVHVGIHHRIGRLAVGEASVVIAAAAAHRDAACRACRYAIERVKQIAPIWKHEYLEDGDAWVEGAVADPADEAARLAARACACA